MYRSTACFILLTAVCRLTRRLTLLSRKITASASTVLGVANGGNTDTAVKPAGTSASSSGEAVAGKAPPPRVPGSGLPGGMLKLFTRGSDGKAKRPKAAATPAPAVAVLAASKILWSKIWSPCYVILTLESTHVLTVRSAEFDIVVVVTVGLAADSPSSCVWHSFVKKFST